MTARGGGTAGRGWKQLHSSTRVGNPAGVAWSSAAGGSGKNDLLWPWPAWKAGAAGLARASGGGHGAWASAAGHG